MDTLHTTPTSPDRERPRRFTGTLTKLHYHNESGFCIVKFRVEESIDSQDTKAVGTTITCKGIFPQAAIDQRYEISGVPHYNQQYQSWELAVSSGKLLENASGLASYLAREAPGIGEERAKRIITTYPENTVANLKVIPVPVLAAQLKMTPAEITTLLNWLQSQEQVLAAKESLYDLGLTQHQVNKFFTQFGDKAPETIRSDPFALTEVAGVGFITAATIADKVGLAATDSKRIRAGVLYAMKETCQEGGHTCLDHIALVNAACELLKIHKNHIITEMKVMIEDGVLCTEASDVREFSNREWLWEKEESHS